MVCVFAGGVILTPVAGIIALIVMSRRKPSENSLLSEYFVWLLCLAFFNATTLALSPFLELPAEWFALFLTSPLFATMIFLVDRAIDVSCRDGWRTKKD